MFESILDEALEAAGGFGRWQWGVFFRCMWVWTFTIGQFVTYMAQRVRPMRFPPMGLLPWLRPAQPEYPLQAPPSCQPKLHDACCGAHGALWDDCLESGRPTDGPGLPALAVELLFASPSLRQVE